MEIDPNNTGGTEPGALQRNAIVLCWIYLIKFLLDFKAAIDFFGLWGGQQNTV